MIVPHVADPTDPVWVELRHCLERHALGMLIKPLPKKFKCYGPDNILDLSTSFERYLYKLSEYFWHWINGTKVMAVERCSTTLPSVYSMVRGLFQLP